MTATTLTVPVLLGTAREGRQSEKVAQFVLAQAKAYGFDSTLVDIRDHVTPMTVRKKDDPNAGVAWEKIIQGADGLIIITPEYNHGYPGELKILLDKLQAKLYADLPVAVCGVSNGTVGGARMIQSLLPVLVDLEAIVKRSMIVNFKNVKELFDEQGTITDARYGKQLTKLFVELQRLAGLFHHAKQS